MCTCIHVFSGQDDVGTWDSKVGTTVRSILGRRYGGGSVYGRAVYR